MKQYGCIYNNFDEMQAFIDSKNINKTDTILIQIFTGVVEVEFIKIVIEEINTLLPSSEIIGTTTAGEIYQGDVFSNTTIISFTIFEKSQVKTRLFSNNGNEYELGVNIVKELVEEDTKVMILFSDGLFTRGDGIMKGIQSANSDIVICGGKAGDNGYLKGTFVFTKEGIISEGVAVASITGENLKVTIDSSFCWSSIGKLMTITKASNNKIFTIDNIRVVDIYKKYLGDEVAKELPMSATEFPLIIKKNGIDIARVAFSCNDDGSMGFLGNFEVGDKVQFGYGNVNVILANSLEIINRLRDKPIEAIFVYSCAVRKSFMQNNIKLEISPLNSIAPTFGFFTHGEFFSANSLNELLNVTMTIVGISEGGQVLKKNNIKFTNNQSSIKNFFEGKDLGIIKVFTNLVNQVTKELQEANKILEEQKSKIEKIKNITNLIMEINMGILSSGEFDSLLQMILDKALDIISGAKTGSILLIENNKLYYKATKGYVLEEIEGVTYRLEDTYQYKVSGISGIDNPVIINELEKYAPIDRKKIKNWEKLMIESPNELLTCGIVIDGKIKGIINIYNTNKQAKFNEEDKVLIKHLASEISIAYKNAELLENIIHMSRYDSLTGLLNRYYFIKKLNETLNEARISGEIIIICSLDLNNLKIVNDTYGHEAGDAFLMKFASVFKEVINENDVMARTGGDEFQVIFINKNKSEVRGIIDRIYKICKNEPLDFNGDNKEISFAFGLAEFQRDADNFSELLKVADNRMYEKKRIMKEAINYIMF